MLPAASVSGLLLLAPGQPLLRRRPDRARPARGLRAPQGRAARRGRALARAEPGRPGVTGTAMPVRGSATGWPPGRCWPTARWARCCSAAASPSAPCSRSSSRTRPELIGAIHREYLAAGADIIETATFGANRFRLAPFGLADRAGRPRPSRRAARPRGARRGRPGRPVAGSIGPLERADPRALHLRRGRHPRRVPRDRSTACSRAASTSSGSRRSRARRRPAIAVDGGPRPRRGPADRGLADLRRGARAGRRHARRTPPRPRWRPRSTSTSSASTAAAGPVGCLEALGRDGRRTGGADRCPTPASRSGSRASSCTRPGPTTSADGRRLPRRRRGHRRWLLRHDAGAHRGDARRRSTRDRAVGRRPRAGRVAGRRHRAAATTDPRRGRRARPTTPPPPPAWPGPSPMAATSICVEIDPPRSVRIERTIEAARLLQAAGVDVGQHQRLGDGPRAHGRPGRRVRHPARPGPRMRRPLHDPRPEPDGARVGAAGRPRAGRPRHPGPHRRSAAHRRLPGRRRASGTSIRSGSSRSSRASTAGEDAAGTPIGQPAGFTIACALDPTAADADHEWDRLERKLAAGAHLIMTQPMYSLEQVEAMFDRGASAVRPAGFPIPCCSACCRSTSARHAEFLHNEVPGITIPDATRARDARRRRARRRGRAARSRRSC